MKKIKIKDLLDLTAYEKQRSEIRTRIMEIKKNRRIHVGPMMMYLFETYDTMLYQVQEMTRAERIVEEEGILGEINAYNELIPDKNQLSATLMIEIDDISERKRFLGKVVDLPDHTYMQIAGEQIKPQFDSRQGSEDKLSSVQYVKFNFSPEQAEMFKDDKAAIKLGFDHSEYSHEYQLTADQKKIFYGDLTEE